MTVIPNVVLHVSLSGRFRTFKSGLRRLIKAQVHVPPMCPDLAGYEETFIERGLARRVVQLMNTLYLSPIVLHHLYVSDLEREVINRLTRDRMLPYPGFVAEDDWQYVEYLIKLADSTLPIPTF